MLFLVVYCITLTAIFILIERVRRRDRALTDSLFEFVDLLNRHGPDSPDVAEFQKRHKDNKELAELMQTTLVMRQKLKSGELR